MSDLKDLSGSDPKEDEQKIGLPAIIIPGEILFNPFVSSTEKILFGFIKSLSKSSRGCWATNLFLSRLVDCSKRSIIRFLSNLRHYKYIKIEEIKKRNGEIERRIFEGTKYHELYLPIVETIHDFLHGDYKRLEEGGVSFLTMGGVKNDALMLLYNTIIDKDSRVSKDTLNDSLESSSEKPSNHFERTSPIPPPDYIKPKTGEYAVLLAWNKFPSPARQHTKLNTKTILQVTHYLDQMRSGIFGDPSRRRWDNKWMDRHKIDMKEFAERRWTFREICKTIEGPLGDMYREGFWPQDKSNLPKSLSDALYNPRTQSSFFVMAYYDPLGPLKSQPMKDPHKGITEDLVAVWHAIDPRGMSPRDWKQYSQGIKGIEKCLGEIDWNNYGARQMFPGGQKGNPYTLVMEYVRWMKGQNPDLLIPSRIVERLNWSMIRPDYWMWQKFMEAVNKYWGQAFKSIETRED